MNVNWGMLTVQLMQLVLILMEVMNVAAILDSLEMESIAVSFVVSYIGFHVCKYVK